METLHPTTMHTELWAALERALQEGRFAPQGAFARERMHIPEGPTLSWDEMATLGSYPTEQPEYERPFVKVVTP